MDGRKYFLAYVDQLGGRPAASQKLGIPYPTICSICNGYRGISKRMAERIAKGSDGYLDANRLIWVRATREAA